MDDETSKKSLTFRVSQSIAAGGIAVATLAAGPGCSTNPAPNDLDTGSEQQDVSEDDTSDTAERFDEDGFTDSGEDDGGTEDTSDDTDSSDAESSDTTDSDGGE